MKYSAESIYILCVQELPEDFRHSIASRIAMGRADVAEVEKELLDAFVHEEGVGPAIDMAFYESFVYAADNHRRNLVNDAAARQQRTLDVLKGKSEDDLRKELSYLSVQVRETEKLIQMIVKAKETGLIEVDEANRPKEGAGLADISPSDWKKVEEASHERKVEALTGATVPENNPDFARFSELEALNWMQSQRNELTSTLGDCAADESELEKAYEQLAIIRAELAALKKDEDKA